MSAGHPEAAHGAHEARHGAHHDPHEAPHGTYESYTRGFVLSVILTAIPFILVMFRPIDSAGYTAAIVLACALIQILVHMIYFLHMSPKAEGGWLLLSTVFTIVLVVIALAGSLWIVYHLNSNMMPSMGEMPNIERPYDE
ncbi:cytochrome o ubiquinol oxidase subunit IV [Amaricoccus solimangrovi]|uniref:Cytochrome bo(3) ubiquinol oxidase subunit 4 n=1 Tax=Amaricoccus solimangrovi TaxID=2589815 RepID=A0A501WNS7_9RHOB|nr:cytochrome o ubiquinol oxidase subunit IV [Amaricoccus solimangrovi]TPE48937.1 cytochrome o ubiquinol oxidase subunit IV [Amaricoccus solimangrovi]